MGIRGDYGLHSIISDFSPRRLRFFHGFAIVSSRLRRLPQRMSKAESSLMGKFSVDPARLLHV